MEVRSLMSGFPALRSSKGTGNPQGIWLEGQWALITELPQGWGNQWLCSWRAPTKSYSCQDPEERSSDPTGDWSRPTCWHWRASCGGMGWQWLTMGRGALAAAALERAPWLYVLLTSAAATAKLLQSCPRLPLTLEPIDPRAGSPHAKQLTGREHNPTHQWIIGLKFYWAQPLPE